MMKKITLYYSVIAALIFTFAACTKDDTMKAVYQTNDGNSAYLRVIHVAPSFRAVFNQADSFNVFVNGSKVNGTFLTYASMFPASTANNAYFNVPSGTATVKFSVAGTVNPDSIAIVSFPAALTAATWYTMLVTDSSRILLDDSYTKPAAGIASIRFINTVMNDTAGKAVDIYSKGLGTNLFSNVKPGGQPTAFINTPTVSPIPANVVGVTDTLLVRRAGTTFTLAQLNGASFLFQRAYTLYYRGSGSLTTGTKARTLTSYVHN